MRRRGALTGLLGCALLASLAGCVVAPPASAPAPSTPSTTPVPASPSPAPTPSAAPPPDAAPTAVVADASGCGPTTLADFVWLHDPTAQTSGFIAPSLLDGLSAPCAVTQPIPLDDDDDFTTQSIAFVDGGAESAATVAGRLVAMGWVQDSLAPSFYDAPDGSAVSVQALDAWLAIHGEDIATEYEDPERWAIVQWYQV